MGTGSADQPVFIVLNADRKTNPAPLLDLLGRHGIQSMCVHVEADVLVRLAQGHVSAVVVLEPRRFHWLDELRATIRRYYGAVPCRQYRVDARYGPQLVPFDAPSSLFENGDCLEALSGIMDGQSPESSSDGSGSKTAPPSAPVAADDGVTGAELVMLRGPDGP